MDIKKNIVLIVTLVVALLVSILLTVLVFAKTKEMAASEQELNKYKKDLEELVQSPHPVKKNLEKIEGDIKMLSSQLTRAHHIFGKPFRKALQAFAAEMEIDEFTLYEAWTKAYSDGFAEKKSPERILDDFLASDLFDPGRDKLDSAVTAFIAEASRNRIEEVTNVNFKSFFLEALGLPRKITPASCKLHISTLSIELAKYLEPEPPHENTHVVNLKGEVRPFTFASMRNSIPLPEDVPFILKHWAAIDDIFHRIKKQQINTVNSFSKLSLHGEKNKGFLIFTYTMDITTSQSTLKNFLNDLNNAWKDNRIYIINDLEVKARHSDISSSLKIATPTSEKDEEIPPADQSDTRVKPVMREILGIDDAVNAHLKFNYVIFIEDELERN